MAALAAGVSRVEWPIFFVYNAAGAFLWATTIALLGYLTDEGGRAARKTPTV